jgi:hypothetical protein
MESFPGITVVKLLLACVLGFPKSKPLRQVVWKVTPESKGEGGEE